MKAGCLLLHLQLPLVFLWFRRWRCLLEACPPEKARTRKTTRCLRSSEVERIVGLVQDGATYRMNEASLVSHRCRIARNDHSLS